VTPIALVIATYTLLAGHNLPGGGFAAGLLVGAVVVLRTVAGLAQPRHALTLLWLGGLIVTAVAIAPVLWGDPLLDQLVISRDVAVFGTVKSGTALVLDVGVMLIVIGLISAVLDGFDASSLVDRGRRPDLATADVATVPVDSPPEAAP
jgi:multicomponent Na+:H+ antiporter subunit A